MSPTGPNRRALDKLEQKKAALNAQIKELKRAERKQKLEEDRQRYVILGRALAKELAENDALAAQLEPLINARVTKAGERKLLGLPPLAAGGSPSAGQ